MQRAFVKALKAGASSGERVECPICDHSSGTRTDLLTHVRLGHPVEKIPVEKRAGLEAQLSARWQPCCGEIWVRGGDRHTCRRMEKEGKWVK